MEDDKRLEAAIERVSHYRELDRRDGRASDAGLLLDEVERLRAELLQAQEREKGYRDALLPLRRKRVWQSYQRGTSTYTLLCAECDRPIDAEGNCDGAGCPFALLAAPREGADTPTEG